MGINSKWWSFTENIVQYEHDEPGVYELGNSTQQVIYIGSSNQIRRRLREHLNESWNTCIKKNAQFYRVEYTNNYKERERQLYDDFVRHYGRPPQCNDIKP